MSELQPLYQDCLSEVILQQYEQYKNSCIPPCFDGIYVSNMVLQTIDEAIDQAIYEAMEEARAKALEISL